MREIEIEFVDSDGDNCGRVTGKVGDNLLSLSQGIGLPLEGTCEGQMACSTCHVIIADPFFDKLEAASEMEEDMLDLASGVRRTSRLACQIDLAEKMDGMVVQIPLESRNMQDV